MSSEDPDMSSSHILTFKYRYPVSLGSFHQFLHFMSKVSPKSCLVCLIMEDYIFVQSCIVNVSNYSMYLSKLPISNFQLPSFNISLSQLTFICSAIKSVQVFCGKVIASCIVFKNGKVETADQKMVFCKQDKTYKNVNPIARLYGKPCKKLFSY